MKKRTKKEKVDKIDPMAALHMFDMAFNMARMGYNVVYVSIEKEREI